MWGATEKFEKDMIDEMWIFFLKRKTSCIWKKISQIIDWS